MQTQHIPHPPSRLLAPLLILFSLFIIPCVQADLGLDHDDFGNRQVSGQQVSGIGLGLSEDGDGDHEGESSGTPGEEGGASCSVDPGNAGVESGICNSEGQCTKTNSYVNLYTRKYQDDIIDMSVKTPGGFIKIQRLYNGKRWLLEHEFKQLDLSTMDQGVIKKSDLSYRLDDSGTFTYKSFHISKQADGFRWENRTGSYILYSKSGILLETGNRKGVLARYNYEKGSETLLSIADRNHAPVFTFKYNTDNPNAISVSDTHNRIVHYQWEENRLKRVSNVLGNSTRYHYHPDTHQLVAKADEAGRKFFITYYPDGGVKSVLSRVVMEAVVSIL